MGNRLYSPYSPVMIYIYGTNEAYNLGSFSGFEFSIYLRMLKYIYVRTDCILLYYYYYY